MVRLALMFLVGLTPLVLAGCKKRPPGSSASQGSFSNIALKNKSYLQLWASKNIAVCFENRAAAAAYTEAIKTAVIRELGRVGFNLKEGWGSCPSEGDSDPSKARLARIRVHFELDLPSTDGGSTAVGAYYGREAVVTLRADPMSYAADYCHKSPATCMQSWAVHEFAHAIGLGHNHNHPLEHPGRMPIAVSNADLSYKFVNYLGDFDPLSIMSASTDSSNTDLKPVDIRTIKALYDEPTVVLQGPSVLRNGRSLTEIDLSVHSLNFPTGMDYAPPLPSAYRYKLVKADESCNTEAGYSSPWPLDRPIKEKLLEKFKPGTEVKICVVGLSAQAQQSYNAHTNLIWLVGPDPSKAYNFEGNVHTDHCSGSLVRFEDSLPTEPAMVLTTARCLELPAGEVWVQAPIALDFYPLDQEGKSTYASQDSETLKASEVIYASYGVSDLGLLQLNMTYAQLGQRRVLTLARDAARVGTEIEILSGLYSEGFSCTVAFIAAGLKEGDASFISPLRYSPACQLHGGMSGAPVLDKKSGKVIAIHATVNEEGESCTQQNPCETTGELFTVKKGAGYGLETALIYGCLGPDRRLDLKLPSCKLPAGKGH